MQAARPWRMRSWASGAFTAARWLTSAVLYVLFLLLPMPYWAAAGVIGVMGLLQGATVPTLVIICCDAFPERTASASSIIVFGVSLASLVTPVLMGRIMQWSPQVTVEHNRMHKIAALSLPRSKQPLVPRTGGDAYFVTSLRSSMSYMPGA